MTNEKRAVAIYKASVVHQTSFIMSDVPVWFRPLFTSSPKKRESRLSIILNEVKRMTLKHESIVVMEETKDSIPPKEEKERFNTTL